MVLFAQFLFAAQRGRFVDAQNMRRHDFEVIRLKWTLVAAPKAAAINRQTPSLAD
jgi:hypothetical protein